MANELSDTVPSQNDCRVLWEPTETAVTIHPKTRMMIQVKERKIPYMIAKDLFLQQVKKNPKKPVEKAIMPAPSKMPNEMFLNLSTSISEMSPWRVFTVKKESPTAKRMARAEITIPMQKMSTERIVRYKAGYFLVLKQQHIFNNYFY